MPSVEAAVPRLRSPAPRASRLARCLPVGILALLGLCILPPGTALADEGSTAPGLTAPAAFRVAPYGGKPRPDREKSLLITYDRGVPRGDANGSTLTMDVTGSSGVLRLERYGNGCSGTNNTRTFDLFGPVPDEAGSGPTSVGVVLVGVLGGCVVLVGAGALVLRKLRGR
jgi:hypothetical protein